MHEPRVFVPQIVQKFAGEFEGVARFKPVFDLSSAAVYGTITPILSPNDDPLLLARLTGRISVAMEGFDSSRDYFLAIGDPSLIAICAGLILRKRKQFKMLKWDKHMGRYIVMDINV
jgi:hypothetical protein